MPRDRHSPDFTTNEKAENHEDLMPLLNSMFLQFQELSKKKPDGVLNKRKVEVVNRLLREIYGIIEGESTSAYLDLLDEDELPQNSDVVLMLGQVAAAMETFKEKYYGYDDSVGKKKWATIK